MADATARTEAATKVLNIVIIKIIISRIGDVITTKTMVNLNSLESSFLTPLSTHFELGLKSFRLREILEDCVLITNHRSFCKSSVG